MLKVKVALVMAVHYVTPLLYSRPQNTPEPLPVSSTHCGGLQTFRFSILHVVKSTTLFPLTGSLVMFLFLASTYNCIGHFLRRKCLLKLVIEGKIEGTRRRGRRRKHLLDYFKETRKRRKLKGEALDRILRTARFEKYYGPLARRYMIMMMMMMMIMIMMIMVVVVVILKVRCQQKDPDVEGRILLNCGS
jgi:hypothetical protein